MTPSSLRGLAPAVVALVAASVGALLVLTLLVLAPTANALPQDNRCSSERAAVSVTTAGERSASSARTQRSNEYAAARDRQRANPSPANKRRAQQAYRDWQEAIAQHERSKRANQQAKQNLRKCQRG